MTNWTDIHEDFGKKLYPYNETCQQKWEQANITKEEAKEWIELGFWPYNLDTVKEWKNFNFSATETKSWLEVGLSKYDLEFASWLRTNNYTPELVKNNLEQLGTDYNPYWLTNHYPNHNIKEIDISGKNLKGELNLSQYQQLESLKCSWNSLTNIILPTSLKKLYLSYNKFNQNLSFLVPCANLETLNLENNKFTGSLEPLKGLIKLTSLDISNTLLTGSLDYLSGMEQLNYLSINDTDINEVQIDKLPRNLEKIEYSTDGRPDCKLTAIVPLLEPVKYGWCDKCQQPNTSEYWCQPCAEQEWKQLTGQELINKFIEQQGKDEEGEDKLQWIPYEEFTDIEHLADGGFSKIYKAKWGSEDMVLKSLNNSNLFSDEKKSGLYSQNFIEFLTEIANTKLVDYGVVECHGISQDPITKNYLMVMKYMKDGNLRQYLQNKDNKLSLEDKLSKLENIASGLKQIHNQNLVHQDFHSGNILGHSITDLGLSRPVNHQKEKGKIFGVLPYVAPEVLQGKPYTQKADIYSLGIIAYEFLANSFPYFEMDNTELTLKVCNGYRPNLDKVPLPQLLKDLIKRCWDSNPDKRPKAEELYKIIRDWGDEILYKINTPFYQQYQEIEAEYDTFSQNIPYQIHGNAITTSKMIDTKQITQLLETYSKSLQMDFANLNLKDNQDWTNLHPSFTEELIQSWQNLNFNYQQTQEWINIGLQPTDYNFATWLRDFKQLTAEEVLNHSNEVELRQEYQQIQTHQEQPPK